MSEANAAFKTYFVNRADRPPFGTVSLFCIGDIPTVQVMRANGSGIAFAISLVDQLIAITKVAIMALCGWPSAIKIVRLYFGLNAVTMIVSPLGGVS